MKNILKLTVVLSFLLAFVACSEGSLDVKDSNVSAQLLGGDNRQVSLKQAELFASIMANNFFASEDNGAQLKSTTANVIRTVDKIQPIIYKDGYNGDTVMFSVSFSNSNGFMIISGDKGDNPIVAVSDTGSMDVNNLNPSLAQWLEGQSEMIALQMQESLHQEDSLFVWDALDLSDSSLLEVKFISEVPKLDPLNKLKSCGQNEFPSGRKTVYSSTGYSLKWGQGRGYNYNAKVSGVPAGCPAVAVGMLCYDQHYPYNYSYYSMPSQLSSYYYNRQSGISLMFRSIADKIPSYSWNSFGSGAAPTNILTGIKRLGYANAKLRTYSFQPIYDDLIKGRSVLLGGYQNGSYSGGHIWFSDGYYEAKVTYTHKKKRWFKWRTHCTWNEYHDYLFMNWGWNGANNGWYRANSAFKPGNSNFNYKLMMFTDLYPVR